jgi:hypothetical protein
VDSRRSRVDNIFIQKSIVMGIGAMTEDDLDLSDSSTISHTIKYDGPKIARTRQLIPSAKKSS